MASWSTKRLPTSLGGVDAAAAVETVVVAREAVKAPFLVVVANSAVACCTRRPADCNRPRQRQLVATFVWLVVSAVSRDNQSITNAKDDDITLTREIINEQFRETGRAINAINSVAAAVAKNGPEGER